MPQSAEVACRLGAVKALPGNDKCVDCGDKGTATWASINFGIIICLKCAGGHRDLGVHITFVQSISMDSWTDKLHHVARLEHGGNQRFIDFLATVDESIVSECG